MMIYSKHIEIETTDDDLLLAVNLR